jgi:hypothetical protein
MNFYKTKLPCEIYFDEVRGRQLKGGKRQWALLYASLYSLKFLKKPFGCKYMQLFGFTNLFF